MTEKGFVYKVVNIANGKIYVGQTRQSLKRRFKGHVDDSKRHDYCFSRAIRKYGKESFHIEKLEEVEITKLNDREVYWIEKLNSFKEGYNSNTGGQVPLAISEETKKKMSKARKGRRISKKHKENISQSLMGRKVSSETREKISNAQKGVKHWCFGKSIPEETKKKMSKSHRGEKNHNSKLSNSEVLEILSLLGEGKRGVDIAKKFGVSRQTISHIKHGRRKTF